MAPSGLLATAAWLALRSLPGMSLYVMGRSSFVQRKRTLFALAQGESVTVELRDRPALVATGDGRVLHVLRPLVRHNSSPGPEPQDAWDDPRYYATAR